MADLLPNLTLQQLLQRLVAYLMVAAVYGFSVAALARRAGDEGPVHDGRLTLNPMVHLNFIGMIASLLFQVGWINSLDVKPSALKFRWLGSLFITVLSSAGLLGFAFACLMLRPVSHLALGVDAALVVSSVLGVTYEVAIRTALLNLLPIPPLVGAINLAVVWPGGASWVSREAVNLIGSVIIVILLTSGVINPLLWAIAFGLRRTLGY